MYTLKKATEILLVSKVTLYKHMEKNGIEKGKKLTDEDIKILKKSISKNLKENPLLNSLQEQKQEFTKEINKRDIEIDELKDSLDSKNIRIRELENLLSQKELLLNQSQIKQAELLENNQKLLESPKKKFWRK